MHITTRHTRRGRLPHSWPRAAIAEEGEQLGLPAVGMEKLRRIGERALGGLEIVKRAGM